LLDIVQRHLQLAYSDAEAGQEAERREGAAEEDVRWAYEILAQLPEDFVVEVRGLADTVGMPVVFTTWNERSTAV
ncbi:UNVERIFIED_CONTAM: hypothetical protein NY603_40700, partial [Bacteroidetes bacterium 56_B9]|jgi:hypothetical protein